MSTWISWNNTSKIHILRMDNLQKRIKNGFVILHFLSVFDLYHTAHKSFCTFLRNKENRNSDRSCWIFQRKKVVRWTNAWYKYPWEAAQYDGVYFIPISNPILIHYRLYLLFRLSHFSPLKRCLNCISSHSMPNDNHIFAWLYFHFTVDKISTLYVM